MKAYTYNIFKKSINKLSYSSGLII